MAKPTRPPRNGFNATMRKIYNPLGFSKGYNFALWFIFGGAMLGFCLARIQFLNFRENFCPYDTSKTTGAAPGECYYYTNFTRYKVGILLHLGGILPAGIIAVLQFTPVIRHRRIILHRIGGYIALFLYLVSIVGALMIARRAFGGGLDVQSGIGALSIAVTGSFIISYVNIRRLQIEQHRTWMLRGWFYAASIITLRLIMIIATVIISQIGRYYAVWPCAKIEFTLSDPSTLVSAYPSCAEYANSTNPSAVSLVAASLGRKDSTAATVGAGLGVPFGMALWLAFLMHAVGVEIYLRLTPKEAQRLRQISYQRQLEAGMRNPGSAGWTADHLGDSDKWFPEEESKENAANVEYR